MEKERSEAARAFSAKWSNHGDEISDTFKFWIGLIRVLGVTDKPENFFDTQQKVEINGHIKRIDAIIPSTKVLIEQKSFGVDLDKKYLQSDGEYLTPFEQAERYAEALSYSDRPRWIVTCNFEEFQIYDLERRRHPEKYKTWYKIQFMNDFIKPTDDEIEKFIYDPKVIPLHRLFHDYKYLNFLVDPNDDNSKLELKISAKAASLVGKIYDSFLKSNVDKTTLNKLCVRLVFCLYADDSALFGDESEPFFNYLNKFHNEEIAGALMKLFEVLNLPDDKRSNIDDKLIKFPYVNGGLFDDKIDVPAFNSDIRVFLLTNAIQKFDWYGINPTIFGAMFESTLDSKIRRKGGMHYTSIENIHKLIDPLFLNELDEEFNSIKRTHKDKLYKLKIFQEKLANLKFFDPACGSGNFLTETYISLRQIENKVIKEIRKFDETYNKINVSIDQFYGIEINDFAVAVAQTAMWIAENQMLQEIDRITQLRSKFLPLKKSANIVLGNALQIDWSEVVSKSQLNYIIGNPPFVGKSYQSKEQKADMAEIFKDVKGYGNLDYVTCWYKKAADFIKGTKIRCAFVSTNSICQGIAVPPLWNYLFDSGITINFAYRTFKWQSETPTKKAAVHCVIVGFSYTETKKKFIFDGEKFFEANNINAYLIDAPNIIVETRSEPLCDVPPMIVGSCPADGSGFIIEAEDYDSFIRNEPLAKKYIRPYIGSEEFINGKKRYCLWLKDCTNDELSKMPLVMSRVDIVRNFRLSSKKEPTRRHAKTPTLFTEDRYIESDSIIIPMLSSSNREYVPIGFVDSQTIINNLASFIPNASNYIFGIIISNICMAWMKIIGSRFKSDYRFSASLVYNTFPFPPPNNKVEITATARNILKEREALIGYSLADMYDANHMPKKLFEAHQANDRAVMNAYSFNESMTESEIVAALMKMYQKMIAGSSKQR